MEAQLVREIGSDWPAQKSYLARQSRFAYGLLEGPPAVRQGSFDGGGIRISFLRAEPIGPVTYPLGDQLAVVPLLHWRRYGNCALLGHCRGAGGARGKSAPAFQSEFVGRLRRRFRVAGALGRILQTPSLCAVTVAAANLLPRIACQGWFWQRDCKGLRMSPGAARCRYKLPRRPRSRWARSGQMKSDVASVSARGCLASRVARPMVRMAIGAAVAGSGPIGQSRIDPA